MKVNLREVSNKFKGMEGRLANIVDREIRKTTLAIEAQAKMEAPVDTGFLRNSIQSVIEPNHGTVSVGAEYGPYVEFGTAFQAAQPYLIPAFDQETDLLIKRLENLDPTKD